MTVRLSYDEGKTWPVKRVLHAGFAAYSCLAALPDSRIGCLFERGDQHANEKITFARFTYGWLTGRRERLLPEQPPLDLKKGAAVLLDRAR
jgi:sialidase-1